MGYTIFNERYIDYETSHYNNDISLCVHELCHALFFHPFLFENNFPDYNGESFYYEEGKIKKLRGHNTLAAIRDHFDCPTADGGKCAESNLKFLWKTMAKMAVKMPIWNDWFLETRL